jgi:hypothetical protein
VEELFVVWFDSCFFTARLQPSFSQFCHRGRFEFLAGGRAEGFDGIVRYWNEFETFSKLYESIFGGDVRDFLLRTVVSHFTTGYLATSQIFSDYLDYIVFRLRRFLSHPTREPVFQATLTELWSSGTDRLR